MDMRELYWAAGMIEGEGCFTGKGATRIMVWQVQRQPLERLQRLFGGTITVNSRKNPKHNDASIWYVGGIQGRGAMMTLYVLMSPKRQAEIHKVIANWKALPGVNPRLEFCKRGHPFTPENTYVATNGKTHACRTCQAMHSRAAADRSKEARHARGLQNAGASHWTKRNKTEYELTHCPHGHERTPENVYRDPKSDRVHCRPCKRAQKKAALAAKRQGEMTQLSLV